MSSIFCHWDVHGILTNEDVLFIIDGLPRGGGGHSLNYTAVHTRDHRFFEPTLSKFYPLVKFIPYSSIFACFFENFAP